MIFERERCKVIEAPTARQLSRELSLTKSSFASLTAEDGSYIQAAGGPGLYLIEYRSPSGVHHRAKQDSSVAPFPDGTVLSFSGGSVKMAQAEWFQLKQVVEIFSAFALGQATPPWLTWQKLTGEFAIAAQQQVQGPTSPPSAEPRP